MEFLRHRPSGVFRVEGFVRSAVDGSPQRYLLRTVGPAVLRDTEGV